MAKAARRTKVLIDPNVRFMGNATYAGFEDVFGPIESGQTVDVLEPESGLSGTGIVLEVNQGAQMVALQVDWTSLRVPACGSQAKPEAFPGLLGSKR
jgi:hypothetical protein